MSISLSVNPTLIVPIEAGTIGFLRSHRECVLDNHITYKLTLPRLILILRFSVLLETDTHPLSLRLLRSSTQRLAVSRK